jgi:hypothetical protein
MLMNAKGLGGGLRLEGPIPQRGVDHGRARNPIGRRMPHGLPPQVCNMPLVVGGRARRLHPQERCPSDRPELVPP